MATSNGLYTLPLFASFEFCRSILSDLDPMLLALEQQHLASPAPPSRRQIPGKHLDARVAALQVVAEHAPHVRFSRMDIRDGHEDPAEAAVDGTRAQAPRYQELLPGLSPLRIQGEDGLPRCRHFQPGPRVHELDAPLGEHTTGRAYEVNDGRLVRHPHGDGAVRGKLGAYGNQR